jgi:hypothetical protein
MSHRQERATIDMQPESHVDMDTDRGALARATEVHLIGTELPAASDHTLET